MKQKSHIAIVLKDDEQLGPVLSFLDLLTAKEYKMAFIPRLEDKSGDERLAKSCLLDLVMAAQVTFRAAAEEAKKH